MHQTKKKGNLGSFVAKFHVEVDAGSGYIHTTAVTAANVPDEAVTASPFKLFCKEVLRTVIE